MAGAAAPTGRHRRWRRMLRTFVWSATLLLIFVAITVLYLRSISFENRLTDRLIREAEVRLERDVEIDRARVEFFPPGVTFENLRVAGPDRDAQPLFSARRLEVGVVGLVDAGTLYRRSVGIGRIVAEEPRIRLVIDENGELLLPRILRGGGGEGAIRQEIPVAGVLITDGLIELDGNSIPLNIQTGGLRVLLERTPRGHLVGEAAAERVRLIVPNGRSEGGELQGTVPIIGSLRTRLDLSTEAVAIERLRLTRPDFDLRADGLVSWGSEAARVEMTLLADGDFAQWTEWTFLEPLASGAPLLSGPYAWNGTLAWVGAESSESGAQTAEPSTWSVAGKLTTPRMAVERLAVRAVLADVEVDPQRVGVRLVEASLLGGRVVGQAEIDLREVSETARTGRVDLQASSVDARQVIQTIVSDVDLAVGGSLEGPLQYRFSLDDPLAGNGRADLVVDAGVEQGSGLRPMRGELPLLIEAGVLSSEALKVNLPGQRVTSRLHVDLRNLETRLQANVQSYDLAALVALALPLANDASGEDLAAAAPDDPLIGFRPVAGRGGFDVDLQVSERATRVDVAFELDQPMADRLVLDQASGTVALASAADGRLEMQGLEARLERGAGAALFIARPRPAEALSPSLDEVSRVHDFGLDLEAWPLQSLVRAITGRPAAGSLAQLDGQVGGHLRWLLPASGLADSAGEMNARVEELSYGDRIQLGAAEVVGTFGQSDRVPEGTLGLNIQRAVLDSAAGAVEVAGSMALSIGDGGDPSVGQTPGQVDLSLVGKNLDLQASPFAELLGLDSEPRWLSITGVVDGSLTAPDANLELSVTPDLDSVALASEESALRVDWQGSDGALHVEGALLDLVRLEGGGIANRNGVHLRAEVGGATLGAVVRAALLRADWNSEDDLGVPGEDPLDRIARGELEGEYRATLELRGGPSAPTEASLRFDALRARLPAPVDSSSEEGALQLSAEEPFTVRWRAAEADAGDRLSLEGLWLRDEASGAEVIVVGSAESSASPGSSGAGLPAVWALDFGVQGTIPARWIEGFAPAVDLDGRIELLAVLEGTSVVPEFDGQMRMADGEARIDGFPHAFEDLDWTALLYPDRVVLDRLSGRLGDGPLRASGDVQFVRDPPTPPAVAMPRVRLDARVENASLRWPEGWSMRGGAEIAFRQSEAGDRVVVGEAKLDRARSLSQLDLSLPQLLRGMFERRRLQVQDTDPLLDTVRLNVEIEGSEALRIENDVARLSGSIDLIAQGTLGRPVVFGEVGLDAGGTVSWGGEDYELTRGVLTFSNPYEIDPLIDIVAVTKRRDYDVVLALSGDRERLEANLTSDPPLPELEVLSLLAAGGTTPGSDTGLGPQRAGSRSVDAADLLYSQASTLVGDRFTRLFGLDRFRLDPLTTGDTLSSARVTLGKRLSSDVFVTYSADPSSSENSILEVEWEVDDNVVLVLRQNADGTYSADLRVEHVF